MIFPRPQFVGLCLGLLLGELALKGGTLIAAERPDIGPQLSAGKLAEAQQALEEHVAAQDDDLARFQLGTIQVVRAIERLSQDGARYGALNRTMMVPFVRVGGFAETGRRAEPVTYDNVRQMIDRFQKAILKAERTLVRIDDQQLAWNLNLDDVRLDMNGDGQFGERETLGTLFRMAANRGRSERTAQDLTVGFDSADVYWLRGYCHLLAALADMILAYDHKQLFEVTAHAFFARPQTEFAARHDRPQDHASHEFWDDLPDLIAAIHLMNFKRSEPERLAAAQEHLLQMVEMSRKSWELIGTETDNNREWIPGANQQSVISNFAMNQQRIDTWHKFLDEAEEVLRGQKLIPFWRRGFDEGVNLHKVFREPRDFDVVLWVQGSAALPYLEHGEKTSPETWSEFQRVFRGEFIGFAAWIN
ncbi:MAG TPA: hypothetical protein VJ828_11955 [Lacipirellulaceae bacterium]|nr:hypothetical protein [Lacipirellulaceae bacterium]